MNITLDQGDKIPSSQYSQIVAGFLTFTAVKQFLIIQTAFLGDVILATPVISELARIYPDCAIDVLVRKGNESLLSGNMHIRELMTLDKKQGKYKSLRLLLAKIKSKRYDEVINLHRFASTGILAAFSGAPSRVGFDKNPLSFMYTRKVKHSLDGRHEVERNLECIAHHGAVASKRPELFPSDLDHAKVKPFTETPYYCLAPASVWFTKQFPAEKWMALGKMLAMQGTVYLIGGPGDHALCEEIRTGIGAENCRNVAGQFSLLESAALMQSAQRSYVNDSGPMHIASAMNAPVTVFYCSTVPAFGFGPLSEDSEIKETMEELDCRPCGLHGYKACPRGHFRCATTITLDVRS